VPVVACRLAGIRTRGRSTARKTRQPEANRRTPPNGGRDLKQRRTGLFRLCQNPNWRTEEACLSCRACGRDPIPLQAKATENLGGRSAFGVRRVQRRSTRSLLTLLACSAARSTVTDGGSTEAVASPSRAVAQHRHYRSHVILARTAAPFEGMPR
jgi:hypothetical protein